MSFAILPLTGGDTGVCGPDLLAGSYNGLAFDAFGQANGIAVEALDGLDDLPAMRLGDVPRGQADGSHLGQEFVDERIVALKFFILADSCDFREGVDRLRAAFTPQRLVELPLYLLNSTRVLNCRTTKRRLPFDPLNTAGFGQMEVELTASDPRVYDAVETDLAVAVAATGGGMTFPMTFPLTFGGAGAGGTFQLNNLGNYPAPMSVRILGPVDNPRLVAVDQGRKVELAGSLGAGEYLDIDFLNHGILLNGSASRRSWLTPDSAWFLIVPGVNNLRYAAGGIAVGSVANVKFRSAWL